MKTEEHDLTGQLIDEILGGVDPSEAAKVVAKMQVAAKIADGIAQKGWSRKDFLASIGRDNPSVATKWLSGTHNFTMDTLVEIEQALGISLLNIEEVEPRGLEPLYTVSASLLGGKPRSAPSILREAKIINLHSWGIQVGSPGFGEFDKQKKA